jgi:hypothetical protein
MLSDEGLRHLNLNTWEVNESWWWGRRWKSHLVLITETIFPIASSTGVLNKIGDD